MNAKEYNNSHSKGQSKGLGFCMDSTSERNVGRKAFANQIENAFWVSFYFSESFFYEKNIIKQIDCNITYARDHRSVQG